MKTPTIQGISAEDLQGDDAFNRLLQGLNPFMRQLASGLANQLTFSENFRAELKTLTVKVPEPAWIAPTLLNGWANMGGTEAPAGYRIDPNGRVWIRGALTGGVRPGVLFTLPVGYRPPYNFGIELATSDAGRSALFIDPTGNVTLGTGASNTWVHLGSISFLATSPAPPATFSGGDWPIYFSTALEKVKMVVPVQVEDPNGVATTTLGGATLDWVRTGDGRIKLKSVHGLTPNRTYKLTVLVTAG